MGDGASTMLDVVGMSLSSGLDTRWQGGLERLHGVETTHIAAALGIHHQQFWIVEDCLCPVATLCLLEGLFWLSIVRRMEDIVNGLVNSICHNRAKISIRHGVEVEIKWRARKIGLEDAAATDLDAPEEPPAIIILGPPGSRWWWWRRVPPMTPGEEDEDEVVVAALDGDREAADVEVPAADSGR